ncbi:MAG: flotillin family protein [Cytophagales bacterium]|nr:flotillin family protein [Cytophagales bacterium]
MTIALIVVFFFVGFIAFILKMYKKSSQGEAIVRTGMGGTKVSFSGIFVFPVIHQMERMDITLKKVTISRQGKDGLICRDNLRADIQVNFFIRVNNNEPDVNKVAKSIGCKRASDPTALIELFDAKFSEALKTVGRHFDYVDLYNSREEFNKKITEQIGKDLNGYGLDDCAIDYLEQTPISSLDEQNILDSEGIKKIIDLTSEEKIKANLILRDKEKTIRQQDVEARETILELDRQLAEKEEKQHREIANIKAVEDAEKIRVEQEERLKAEQARISTQEALGISEENKMREILIAQKNKEKTVAVENERVEREKQLEETERLRIVELAQIEKEKALEEERKNIQDVIRERVIVEKAVVEEEEKIKDTKALAEADREKDVALKEAEKDAQEALIRQTKQAEASKQAAEFRAKQVQIEAEAEQTSALKKAEAIKVLADAEASKQAAVGLAEAQVMEAKAEAKEKEGETEARVLELNALADAKGIRERSLAQAEADLQIGQADAQVIEARASAEEKKGLAEAKVLQEKLASEAKGIEEKAAAMQKLDGVGREHEEFKLRLEKETKVDLAHIQVQKDIAEAQATVLAEAMKSAKIDIVGGEPVIFDKIMGAIAKGKSIDRLVDNSKTVEQIKDTFFDTSNGGSFKENLANFIDQFNIDSETVKNLSVATLLNTLSKEHESDPAKIKQLEEFGKIANVLGIANQAIGSLGIL